jgi:hypothetical protein
MVVQKSDLLAGASPDIFLGAPDTGHFTMRPAHSLVSLNTQWGASVNVGTDTHVHLWRITGTPENSNVAISDLAHVPVGSMTSACNRDANGNPVGPACAAQPGTAALIDTGDNRILDAFLTGGNRLWVSATNLCDFGGGTPESCLSIQEIDIGSFSLVQDILYGSGGGEFLMWPAIRPDAAGNLYAVFSRAAAGTFAETRIAGRLSADPLGALGPTTLLKAGEGPYDWFRWGDYFGAARDPCDPDIVWLAGQFADVGMYADWGTWVGATTLTGVPINDNRCNAREIEPGSVRFAETQGTALSTSELGEPDMPCSVEDTTVWYKYTPDLTQQLTAATLGSSFDTQLGVWVISGPGALDLLTCNDNAQGTAQSSAGFTAVAGRTYFFQVDGFAGSTGSLAFTLKVGNDDFADAIPIPGPRYFHAQNTSGATGQGIAERQPSCFGADSSVWYTYSAGLTQELRVETLGSAFDTQLAVWRGTAPQALAEVACANYTGQESLGFTAEAGQTYYFQADGASAAAGDLHLALELDNDDFANAVQVFPVPYTVSQNTLGATAEGILEPQPACFTADSSVWYRFQPVASQNVVVSALGSGYDTQLALWRGRDIGSLQQQSCLDQAQTSEALSFTSTAFETYHIQVNAASAAGDLTLSVASDSDLDTVADAADNCSGVPNADQSNADADSLGDACDPGDSDFDAFPDNTEYFCGSPRESRTLVPERSDTAVDDDGDGLINEPLPAKSDPFDCDGDGYTGLSEASITTLPHDPCGLNGWSSNLVDPSPPPSPAANRVDLYDILSFVAPDRRLDTNSGEPFFSVRWDISPGSGGQENQINIADLTTLFNGGPNSPAHPPMFRGQLAYDRTCPSAP